jgi:hypothetical protein
MDNQLECHDEHKFIAADSAYTFACGILKSGAIASQLLRSGLADGSIAAEAEAILVEPAFASVKPLHKRRIKYVIDLKERSQHAALRVQPSTFKRPAKGGRIIYNWNLNRVVSIDPPINEIFTHRPSGRLGTPLQNRIVLYGVHMDRLAVERAVSRLAGHLKAGATLSAKPKRAYEPSKITKDRLSKLYELAKAGNLGYEYGPFNEHGAKAYLEKVISKLVVNDYKSTKLHNLATELINIDNDVRTSREMDQLMTSKI